MAAHIKKRALAEYGHTVVVSENIPDAKFKLFWSQKIFKFW